MAKLNQTKFLGCSVKSINSSLGWNSEPTQYNIILAEDRSDGDRFTEPPVGTPALFQLNLEQEENESLEDFLKKEFKFVGIVQSWKKVRDVNTGEIFKVSIVDPRSILESVNIITDRFSDTVGLQTVANLNTGKFDLIAQPTGRIPNVINAFGWWEDNSVFFKDVLLSKRILRHPITGRFREIVKTDRVKVGFGQSGSNETGMPWWKIKDAIQTITNRSVNIFGGPIKFRGVTYRLDLSSLPPLASRITLEEKLRRINQQEPFLGNDFRINGSVVSVMDFVSEVCNATGCDFFVTMEQRLDTTVSPPQLRTDDFFIKIHVISRLKAPQLDRIKQFVIQNNGRAKELGRELRNDTTSKFLIGGNKQNLEIVESDIVEEEAKNAFRQDLNPLIKATLADNERNNSIWQFWGFSPSGNIPVMGKGFGDLHTFNLDARELATKAVKNFYPSDVEEMRAALIDKDNWEEFIQSRLLNEFHPQCKKNSQVFNVPQGQDGTTKFIIRNLCTEFEDSKLKNPHFNKALRFGLIDEGQSLVRNLTRLENLYQDKLFEWTQKGNDVTKSINIFEFYNTWPKEQIKKLENTFQLQKEDERQTIYDFVKEYAESFYGKQFMVRLPKVQYTRDSFSNDNDRHPNIKFSHEPTEGGFLSSGEWRFATQNNLLPDSINIDRLMLDDGRIGAYARFRGRMKIENTVMDNLVQSGNINAILKKFPYDFSEIDKENLVFSSPKTIRQIDKEEQLAELDTFVKCKVQPKIIFGTHVSGLFPQDPRAIIELPGKVTLRKNPDILMRIGAQTAAKEIERLRRTNIRRGISQGDITKIANRIHKRLTNFANDLTWQHLESPAISPDLVGIPLRDNTNTYGPWFSVGISGATEVEEDDTLVPWNYGGFDNMNLAATHKVSNFASIGQEFETGRIEIEGTPDVHIGRAILAGGPIVTNMSFAMDNEITTTYQMQTWTPKFGRISDQNVRKIQSLGKQLQQQRKLISELNKKQKFRTNFSKIQTPSQTQNFSKRQKSSSSQAMIVGNFDSISSGIPESGDYSRVFTQPLYNTLSQLAVSDPSVYQKQFGMSLDGLFRPFSTNPNASGIPKFELPTDDAATPTIEDLNPFFAGSLSGIGGIRGRNDIGAIVHGSGYPTSGIYSNLSEPSRDYRGIGLRAPIILEGWGFDTDGNPVPSGADGEFIPNHRKRSEEWPVGPLDARWDRERKVWVAGGTTIREGFLVEDLKGDSAGCGRNEKFVSTAKMHEYETSSSGLVRKGGVVPSGQKIEDIATIVTVTSRDPALALPSGNYIMTGQVNSENRPLWVSCR